MQLEVDGLEALVSELRQMNSDLVEEKRRVSAAREECKSEQKALQEEVDKLQRASGPEEDEAKNIDVKIVEKRGENDVPKRITTRPLESDVQVSLSSDEFSSISYI